MSRRNARPCRLREGPDGEAGEHFGFGLVRGQARPAQTKNSSVAAARVAAPASSTTRTPRALGAGRRHPGDHGQRDFQLHQHRVTLVQQAFRPRDVVVPERSVRPADDDDAVARLPLQEDDGYAASHARSARTASTSTPSARQARPQGRAEVVLPHSPHQRGRRTQARAGHGLIGALPSREGPELLPSTVSPERGN